MTSHDSTEKKIDKIHKNSYSTEIDVPSLLSLTETIIGGGDCGNKSS